MRREFNKFYSNNDLITGENIIYKKHTFSSNILHISRTLKKEFFRKSIHMMSAFVPLLYFYFPALVLTGLLFITLVYFISEVLRSKNINLPIISKITVLASRTRDEGGFVLGPITLSIGIFLAFTMFDYRIATIAIFALSFGDGVASLFGKIIGGVKIPLTFGKTVSGSMGAFLVLFIVYLVCGINILQAFLIAFFATIVEAIPTADFDNLILPVFVGIFVQKFIF
ncbi:MAG TPA: phosphatidate cytidylyltransferase [Spirochaetota bacterium]|nr:phosphatidate cytidylyltransferase [Spirochaetota bacterium]HOL56301.1 phosphatidate cytidylyltransferase [Spirochaetota bacterium]HPP03691.1 phosphatidate cytidylyltransferase [Spirochaetota bacterium]